MKLEIFTIVLDGQPWIEKHLTEFELSGVDYRWNIVEGVAANVRDTAWCRHIEPRLSNDGTTEYLKTIAEHPRVRLFQSPLWNGKAEMVNIPLLTIDSECVLLQVDSDEMWSSDQLRRIVDLFTTYPHKHWAQFFCRYFVGPDIVITSENTYGNKWDEWKRAWRFTPGSYFQSHEPPVLTPSVDNLDGFSREYTASRGLIFDHMAYATERQVMFKERYYGYGGAVHNWRRLQSNQQWPARLRDFLPWVNDDAIVERCQAPT